MSCPARPRRRAAAPAPSSLAGPARNGPAARGSQGKRRPTTGHLTARQHPACQATASAGMRREQARRVPPQGSVSSVRLSRRMQSFLHLTEPDAIRCSRNLRGSRSPAHLQAIKARYASATRDLQSLALNLLLPNSGAKPPRTSLAWSTEQGMIESGVTSVRRAWAGTGHTDEVRRARLAYWPLSVKFPHSGVLSPQVVGSRSQGGRCTHDLGFETFR